jgi:hypothetical protein
LGHVINRCSTTLNGLKAMALTRLQNKGVSPDRYDPQVACNTGIKHYLAIRHFLENPKSG